MEYVIMILLLLLFLALFFLWNLKRGIHFVQLELEKKFTTKSSTLLTSPIGDKDLSQLIETLNVHMKELLEQEASFEQKNNHLRKMITNISHDLRTPLTSALGYLDLLGNASIPIEEREKEILIVEERLKRLSELVDSFFEFSRIILYDDSPTLESVNLIAIMEQTISHHYDDYSKQHRMIQLETSDRRIMIHSNPILLSRIFDNLIHNAYQHSLGDLTILITRTSKITIVFQNDLLEFDFDPKQIFEEFYTIDISRTKGNTGLGLAIAKEFTIQLNGMIWAEKKHGKLEIIIEFPEMEGL